MSINVFRPFITRKDMDSVLNCLVSENLDYGAVGKIFSSELGQYIGIEDGYLLKEYTRSLEIIFKALEMEKDSIIILTPLTPLCYRSVIKSLGCNIEYADIEPDNGCISLNNIHQIIADKKEQVKAVIVDSPLGFVPEIEKIAEIEGIAIIEDISNMLGAEVSEKKCGSFGNYTVINLDSSRIITAGSGTFISGKSKKEKEKLKSVVDSFLSDIFLPDMNSSIGLSQLNNIEKHINLRKEIADSYIQSVMKTRHKTLSQKNDYKNIYYSFPVLIEGSSVKEIKKYALKKKIEVKDAFENSIISREKIENCPEAEKLNMRCVLFPLYPNIGKSNAEKIIKVLTTLP